MPYPPNAIVNKQNGGSSQKTCNSDVRSLQFVKWREGGSLTDGRLCHGRLSQSLAFSAAASSPLQSPNSGSCSPPAELELEPALGIRGSRLVPAAALQSVASVSGSAASKGSRPVGSIYRGGDRCPG